MPTTTLPPPGPGGPPASLAPAVPAAGTRPPPRPACVRPRSPRFVRGLRRRQARDRDAVGRAAHVVHAGAMAEAYRARLTPVLTTDADLEAPAPHRHRRLHDGPSLHLQNLGKGGGGPAAAVAEHRVGLPELLDPPRHRVDR